MSLLPSKQEGGCPGEASSYLEMVNWLLRTYATENNLHAQEAEFNSASQDLEESENAFYTLREIHAKCGYIQTGPQLRARFVQALRWEVRLDVNPYFTDYPEIPLLGLVQYAHEGGDAVRRRKAEANAQEEAESSALRDEDAAKEAERAARCAQSRKLAAAVTSTAPVAVVTRSSSSSTPPIEGGTSTPKREDTPHRFPCGMCNSMEHWKRLCGP